MTASEALARIFKEPLIYRHPPVVAITVTNPGNADTKKKTTYFSDLDRYILRPLEFADMTILEFYGQTLSKDKFEDLPQYVKDAHSALGPAAFLDRCDGKPRWVYRRNNPIMCRVNAHAKKNSEQFYLRMLLLHSGATPTSYEELKQGPDGQQYESYNEAADAYGLIRNGRVRPVAFVVSAMS